MTEPMTQLYLIRHGQAVVNVTRIIGGMRGDTGLTARGVEQAEHLRDRLAATREIPADVLITSTMPRARQTARIIAPAFGLSPLEDSEFQELNPGEADGLSFEEYEARYGKLKFDPIRPLSPGGETWATFLQRLSNAYTRIIEQHAGKTVAIVCHGWVIEASFVHFMALNQLEPNVLGFQVSNTSLTHWEQFQRNNTFNWRLGRYNDAVHLHAAVRWSVEGSTVGAGHHAVPLGDDDTVIRVERS